MNKIVKMPHNSAQIIIIVAIAMMLMTNAGVWKNLLSRPSATKEEVKKALHVMEDAGPWLVRMVIADFFKDGEDVVLEWLCYKTCHSVYAVAHDLAPTVHLEDCSL